MKNASTRDRYADLTGRWELLRCQCNQQLENYIDGLSQDCPDRLREAIRYSLLSQGKRMRPLLTLLAAEAVGGEWRNALPAACAVEMVHCYSLIHDDLPSMDDDDLRRGVPTCHRQFDEATAILAGDALQSMAYGTLVRDVQPLPMAMACVYLLSFAAGPEALVGGQMDDVMAEKNGGDAELLKAIHRRKTGSMIRVSVEMGAMLGGATTQQLDRMRQYGERIGLAFQIIDDLLDVESSSEALGKRTGKDHDRGKLTYPRFYGPEASRMRAEELVNQAVSAVEILGERATPLIDLARFVLDRSN